MGKFTIEIIAGCEHWGQLVMLWAGHQANTVADSDWDPKRTVPDYKGIKTVGELIDAAQTYSPDIRFKDPLPSGVDRNTPVKFHPYLDNHVNVAIPPKSVVDKVRDDLPNRDPGQGLGYDLPRYYEEKLRGPQLKVRTKDALMDFHECRIGEYCISECE